MALIFYDNFNGANNTELSTHSPDTGTSWTRLIAVLVGDETLKLDGAGAIRGLVGGNSDGVLYTANTTYSSKDYDVETTAGSVDNLDDWSILAGRIQDDENMYIVSFRIDLIKLHSKTTDTPGGTELDTLNITVSTDDVIKLEMRGSTIKVYINGTERLSATDTDHTEKGKAGIGLGAVMETGADISTQTLKDFTVTEVEEAAGFTRKIKISGTFQDKPIKTKVAGTFEDKPIKIKVGGTFQDA